jgi:hypothetical protein
MSLVETKLSKWYVVKNGGKASKSKCSDEAVRAGSELFPIHPGVIPYPSIDHPLELSQKNVSKDENWDQTTI